MKRYHPNESFCTFLWRLSNIGGEILGISEYLVGGGDLSPSFSGRYCPAYMVPDSHTLFMWYSKLGTSKNVYSMVCVQKTKAMGVKSRKGTFFERVKNHHLIMLLYLHRRRGWWSGQCFPKWPREHSKTDVEQAKEHHWQSKYIQTIITQINWKQISIHSNITTAYFHIMNIHKNTKTTYLSALKRKAGLSQIWTRVKAVIYNFW